MIEAFQLTLQQHASDKLTRNEGKMGLRSHKDDNIIYVIILGWIWHPKVSPEGAPSERLQVKKTPKSGAKIREKCVCMPKNSSNRPYSIFQLFVISCFDPTKHKHCMWLMYRLYQLCIIHVPLTFSSDVCRVSCVGFSRWRTESDLLVFPNIFFPKSQFVVFSSINVFSSIIAITY